MTRTVWDRMAMRISQQRLSISRVGMEHGQQNVFTSKPNQLRPLKSTMLPSVPMMLRPSREIGCSYDSVPAVAPAASFEALPTLTKVHLRPFWKMDVGVSFGIPVAGPNNASCNTFHMCIYPAIEFHGSIWNQLFPRRVCSRCIHTVRSCRVTRQSEEPSYLQRLMCGTLHEDVHVRISENPPWAFHRISAAPLAKVSYLRQLFTDVKGNSINVRKSSHMQVKYEHCMHNTFLHD